MTSLPVRQSLVIRKPCGDCHACCTIMAVESIGKKAGEPCKHLTSDNGEKHCELGEYRPDECRKYFCQWTYEQMFDDQLRPDRCGVVVETGFDGDNLVTTFNEGRAGDFYRSRYRKMADFANEELGITCQVRCKDGVRCF